MTIADATYDHSQDTIAPHGGVLVDRFVDDGGKNEIEALVKKGATTIALNDREHSDLEMMANGALSPLTGYLGRDDYEAVVTKGRLASGVPWTIPVTLSSRDDNVKKGQQVLLTYGDKVVGAMAVEETFAYDKAREAKNVFGTDDTAHPSVAYLMNDMGDTLVGGPVFMLAASDPLFPAHHNEPRALRKKFRDNGWKRVVAFQTRNPIHRAHEYITKTAAEICDGLLIHPLVGYTKGDDIPADTRMKCYEQIMALYYPKDRVMLSTLPAAMRYAGPKEAIFHAIMRKNYGCTHFIVGRDHAGVGSYYGTYDAQQIFDNYTPKEMGITPLRFEHSFFCKQCSAMASAKSCPHDKEHHIFLSGTKVREMLKAGERPPAEFTRPEIADLLIEAAKR